MICGAAEAPLTPITFGAFDVVNVLSVRNDQPQKASRPLTISAMDLCWEKERGF